MLVAKPPKEKLLSGKHRCLTGASKNRQLARKKRRLDLAGTSWPEGTEGMLMDGQFNG